MNPPTSTGDTSSAQIRNAPIAPAAEAAVLLEAADVGLLIVGVDGIVLHANARARSWLAAHAPLEGKPAPVAWASPEPVTLALPSPNGGMRHVRRSVAPVTWSGAPAHLVTLHDITAQVVAEERLKRLGRLQAALGQTAAALGRATSEADLLEDACRIGVALAGFQAVWIGRANAAHTEVVRVAGAGAAVIGGDRLALDISQPTGHGPVAQTLLLGVPYICNRVDADSRLAFWEATARQLHIASLAVFPLHRGGAVHAIMAFYARDAGAFDHELVSILTQIAGEISGALERLAGREQRRRLESTPGEAEARLRVLARASRQVLWMRDGADGRLLYVSPAFERVFGCPPDRFLESTQAWLPLVHPDDRARFPALPAGPGSAPVHYRIVRPDGGVRWIEDEILPVEEQGRVRFFAGSAADITRRHEAARQLELFRSLIDAAGDVFYILRPADDFRLVYINDAGVRHFGWSREELASMRPWDWDPNFSRENTRALWEMLKTRGPVLFETTTRRKDGGLVRVEVVSSRLCHDDGEYNVGCFRDVSARARAEADLRTSEERFRAVFDEATDALLLADPESGRFADANDAAVRLFEADDKGRLLAASWPGLLARRPADDEAARQEARVRAEGSWSGLLEHRSLKGRHFWGAVVVRRIEVGGRPLHILRITDTTEHRRLVELLAETEQLARIGGWEYHIDEQRLVWTDGCSLIHGLPPGTQVTTEQALAMHAPRFHALIEEAAREAVRTGRPWTLESCIVRDGRETWVRVTGACEMSDGRPWRLHGTITDISESRAVAAALRERNERLHEQALLIDEAADAIILCDADGRIQLWNRGAERLLGWSRDDAVGRHAGALHLADQSRFATTLAAARERGMWSGELEYVTRSGVRVLVESRWTLILDPSGRPRTILTINTDITERRRREAGQLRAQRLESIGTLAGGIAHDLNNILAPVVLSSDILRLRTKDETDLDLINAIGTSARRGAEIVRQVLSFARGVEGTHVPLNVRHLLPEIRNIVTETFPRTIACRVEAPYDLWSVMGEPTQLHQVLLNLCLNARDAMPDGGVLALRASNLEVDEALAATAAGARTGPHVRVQVSDTGCGIDPALRERIFEPFFTTKGPGRGSGLGLSTTMAIVRSHGGFLTLESEPGRGTTVSIHLPAEQPAPAAGPAAPTAPSAEASARGRTILVIDDEASVRSMTRQGLEGAGYRVLAAEDGARGIALFSEHRDEIALVLTDLMMPVMDGVAVIKSLRRSAPGARIIAMSGATDATGLAGSLPPASGVGFLLKPFNLESLLRAVHDAIGTPSLS